MKWHSERDGTSTIKGRISGAFASGGTCRSHVVSQRDYGRGFSITANPKSWLPYLKDPRLSDPCLLHRSLPGAFCPRVKQFKSKKQIRLSFPLSYPFDPIPLSSMVYGSSRRSVHISIGS